MKTHFPPAALVILVGTTYFAVRLYKANDRESRRILGDVAITSLLLFPAAILAYQESYSMYASNTLSNMAAVLFEIGTLRGYFFALELTTNKRFDLTEVLRDRLFRFSTFLISVIASLMIISTTILGRESRSIFNPLDFSSQWDFVIIFTLHYLLLAYIASNLSMLIWHDMRARPSTLLYRARRFIWWLGVMTSSIFMILSSLNILFIITDISIISRLVNYVVLNIGFPIVTVLLAIALATPEPAFRHLIRPYERYHSIRSARQHQEMEYLHQRIVSIVPNVIRTSMLPGHQDILMHIHVAEAREYIWSQVPGPERISAREDAERIMALIQDQIVICKVGEYPLPRTIEDDMQHNFAVARQLKRLENEQNPVQCAPHRRLINGHDVNDATKNLPPHR